MLHDPVWFDHLPYIPFPDHWPVFTPKDQMGDWLEMYTKVMELNYWTSTRCERARFDEARKTWIVEARSRRRRQLVLEPKQLVFATGAYGPPRWIKLPGAERFQGALIHSSEFQSGKSFAGKRCRRDRRGQLRP